MIRNIVQYFRTQFNAFKNRQNGASCDRMNKTKHERISQYVSIHIFSVSSQIRSDVFLFNFDNGTMKSLVFRLSLSVLRQSFCISNYDLPITALNFLRNVRFFFFFLLDKINSVAFSKNHGSSFRLKAIVRSSFHWDVDFYFRFFQTSIHIVNRPCDSTLTIN